MNKSITLAFAVFLLNSPAIADVCDYRPSQLIGGAGAGALGAVGASTAAVGLGAQAAGFYTLTNAVTNLLQSLRVRCLVLVSQFTKVRVIFQLSGLKMMP